MNLNKRVAILLDHPGQNDSRVLRLAYALIEEGYEVKIFAADPFQGEPKEKQLGDNLTFQTLSFDIKSGISRAISVSKAKPESRRRNTLTPNNHEHKTSNGKLKKLKSLIGGFAYFKAFLATFRNAVIEYNPSIIHANDLSTLYAGYKLKKICKSKLIYDSHEYEVSRYKSSELPFFIRCYRRYVEDKYAPHADAILTVSDSLADKLHKRLNTKYRPYVILNSPKLISVISENLSTLRKDINVGLDAPIALIIGNIQKGRGHDLAIEACSLLDNFHLVCLGAVVDKYDLTLKLMAKNLGYETRLHLLPPKPNDDLIAYIQTSSVSLVLLEKGCLSHEFALPNKVFESRLANIPVIVSPLTELKKFADYHESIFILENSEPKVLAKKMIDVIALPQLYPITNFINGPYSAQTQAVKIQEIYRALSCSDSLPKYDYLPHYSPPESFMNVKKG